MNKGNPNRSADGPKQAKRDDGNLVAKVKLRGISASIFANTTDSGVTFHKVAIQRTYKDGDTFKTSTTFGRDDLPLVEQAAHAAWLEIMKQEQTASLEKHDTRKNEAK